MHYLPRNDSVWTPAAVIVLDSETRTVGEGPTEAEQLRCWCARFTRRRHRRKAGEIQDAEGLEGREAAAAIDAWASSDKSTWLYAHNVTFDLVTTQLAEHLAELGWELSSRHAVSGSSPWLVLHKGKQIATTRRRGERSRTPQQRVKWQHTLTIADSFSILPVRLDTVGEYAPEPKPPLPAEDAPIEQWLARCWADVRILTWALMTLMDWWEANELGQWAVSGAGSGWNSYRHIIGRKAVVIDPEPDVTEWEHAAIYGGRRDVFRCGQLARGRYAEIDLERAYPTIAATQPLPCKRIGRLTPKIAESILRGSCPYGMIAEVTITSDQGRWPLRIRGRVFYPVGTFRTVLAGPEIAEARRLGALDEIGPGWFYGMSDHMQPWARWVLSLQDADEADVPGPVKIAAKAWSRSVCGKWAQRGWAVTEIPGEPYAGWSYEDTWIAGTDARASICGLNGTHWLAIADQESEHEFPAVLAYIESHCRSRLGRIIDGSPPDAIIQCDTDGVMASLEVLEQGLADRLPWLDGKDSREQLVRLQLESWSNLAAPLTMRIKNVFAQAIVYGPQHVVLDGKARFSGVPRSAWQTGDQTWAARLWPGLSWQINHDTSKGYQRPVQPYLVVGPYAAGWVLASGQVRPAEAATDADGQTDLLPWPQTRWAAQGDHLAAEQALWATTLMGENAPCQEAEPSSAQDAATAAGT